MSQILSSETVSNWMNNIIILILHVMFINGRSTVLAIAVLVIKKHDNLQSVVQHIFAVTIHKGQNRFSSCITDHLFSALQTA